MITRRGLVRVLGGLVAAPAIVPVSSLMGLRGEVLAMPGEVVVDAAAALAASANAEMIAVMERWLLRARAGKINSFAIVGVSRARDEVRTDYIVPGNAYDLTYGLDHLRGRILTNILGEARSVTTSEMWEEDG